MPLVGIAVLGDPRLGPGFPSYNAVCVGGQCSFDTLALHCSLIGGCSQSGVSAMDG